MTAVGSGRAVWGHVAGARYSLRPDFELGETTDLGQAVGIIERDADVARFLSDVDRLPNTRLRIAVLADFRPFNAVCRDFNGVRVRHAGQREQPLDPADPDWLAEIDYHPGGCGYVTAVRGPIGRLVLIGQIGDAARVAAAADARRAIRLQLHEFAFRGLIFG